MEAGVTGHRVIAGSLRNCRAVAKYAETQGKSIALIPAGERWSNGSLRPAIEDLIAVGAIVANLSGSLSPEASVALAAWDSAKDGVYELLSSCASGRELIERGFEDDVRIASQIDSSVTVPVLGENGYVGAVRKQPPEFLSQ